MHVQARGTWTLPPPRLWSGGRASAVYTMLRMDRLSQRLLCLWALSAVPQLACTLITDVDRSKIPPPAIIEPDPEPDSGAPPPDTADAGPVDAGAGNAGDAGDAATAEPESDAGVVGEVGDAAATDAG